MSWLYTFFIGIIIFGLACEAFMRFTARRLDVLKKHCYVTGGNSGLGLAVAKELFKRGATVTIVAQRIEQLKEAAEEIEKFRVNESQKVVFVSVDCTDKQKVKEAIEISIQKTGQIPEYVFTCAGASYPGLFVEQDVEVHEKNMNLNYFGSLYTIHECVKRMVEAKIKGNVILVGSTLSMLSFVGFSQYSPTKYAIRGLAEALRNELKMYGINVHVYFPGTILSPGLETENQHKPQITKDIEGAEDGLTPEQCATALFKGIDRGEVAITSDLISLLFRVSTRGGMPTNNFILDTILASVAWIAFIPWRWYTDYLVLSQNKNLNKKEQ
ncbi:hypothetical protein BB561_006245 [Smittium simulii]|uniref:3-dehydrosphinganine reductase n=1 Tax=Smittium simulii TaxID=133385 RepID=A0A2T9Y5S1_9FUNG|nr:hypothetical protein BB561_006245 [Smittium simulii]